MPKTLLVITRINDPFELPLYVCDTLIECADWLGCSVHTLYKHKRYANYNIHIVINR